MFSRSPNFSVIFINVITLQILLITKPERGSWRFGPWPPLHLLSTLHTSHTTLTLAHTAPTTTMNSATCLCEDASSWAILSVSTAEILRRLCWHISVLHPARWYTSYITSCISLLRVTAANSLGANNINIFITFRYIVDVQVMARVL